MDSIDYIGFDIHKKTISFCAKAQDGHARRMCRHGENHGGSCNVNPPLKTASKDYFHDDDLVTSRPTEGNLKTNLRPGRTRRGQCPVKTLIQVCNPDV